MKSPVYRLAILAAAAFSVTADNLTPPNIRPLSAPAGPRPFAYMEAPDKLPNYLPSDKWGVQGAPLTTMQAPMSPEESSKRMVVQPGFTVKLWAHDPDITKPIAMAWDGLGRLWIAETVDYPNEQQPDGQGRDRIKICEDTDDDGKADKFTIFADKLSIPTSLCFGNGGLIVIEGGHTLFLKDNNGDDVADERTVLFSGWSMNDTHATASNLRYGLDNWIWGTVGYSGFNGTVGGKQVRFGMGVFRFKPDGSALEFIRSSNNNTWGLGLTEDGIVLGSTANGNAAWYMAIPNRFYEAVSGWSASRMETVADSQAIYPVTEKVRQVDWHNKYTAGAGSALYTARAFPKEFWNQISFVCEPTGHLIGWFRWERQGADFKAVNLGSFLASDDEWTAPIVAEVGPDGALWVLDWYNYIVQHNPVPQGFKNGKGNAYETPIRDKRHGRVYRVETKHGGALIKLKNLPPERLVSVLKFDNQFWRMHAQRLLVERGDKSVVPALGAVVASAKPDALGLNPAAVHALWTLHGLGAVGDVAVAALKNPSADVRRAAVNVLPRSGSAVTALLASEMLADKDAQVRLATLLALAESPEDELAGAAVAVALKDKANADDRWLREAATAAAVRHNLGFGRALLEAGDAFPPSVGEVIRVVARHYASPAPDNIVGVVAAFAKAPETTTSALLDGLTAGWPDDKKPALDAEAREQLTGAMNDLTDSTRAKLLVLAQKWGAQESFKDQFTAATKSLRGQLANASLADADRLTAARNLLRLDDQPDTVKAVLGQITPQSAPTFGGGLLGALTESRLASTGGEIIGVWTHLSPGQKRAALGTLLRRAEWAGTLLDAVSTGAVLRNDLGQEHWQQLRNHRDRDLARRARELANAGQTISADRQEVVQKLMPAAKQAGDVAAGKEHYTKNCAVCHKLEGQGQNIGPELTGVGARPKDDILMEILDPNRSVEANYRLWTVTTKDGESLAGRLDAETQTSVEITDLTGMKHIVQRKDITSLESSNQSIMPTGFEQLGEKGLADLLAFLATSHEGPAKK
jgi:putative membrane-bound dehydrogenase-like protein